ncbi:hypothetical protein DFJ73DRAFT_768210 [Zopfochytrium polystomum]|nr:hypothetical protein DFJ73DRAFT_768210 [Zopfochytrium polystomum]
MCDYEYVKGAKKGTVCGVKSRDGKEKCSKHRKEGKGEEKKVVTEVIEEGGEGGDEERGEGGDEVSNGDSGMIMRYVGEVKGSIDETLKWERETGIKTGKGKSGVKCEKCKRSKRLMVECREYNKRMDVIRMEGEEEYEREYKLMAWSGLGWGPKREDGDEEKEWKKRTRKVLAGEKIEFLSHLGGEHREQRKEKRKMNSIKKGKNKGQSEIEIDERFSSPIGWVDPMEVPLGKIINHFQTVLDDDDDPVWRLMKRLSEEVLKKKLGDPGKETLGSENETYQVTYDKKTGNTSGNTEEYIYMKIQGYIQEP